MKIYLLISKAEDGEKYIYLATTKRHIDHLKRLERENGATYWREIEYNTSKKNEAGLLEPQKTSTSKETKESNE